MRISHTFAQFSVENRCNEYLVCKKTLSNVMNLVIKECFQWELKEEVEKGVLYSGNWMLITFKSSSRIYRLPRGDVRLFSQCL